MIFSKLENSQAFAKIGVFGFSGSGKSFTAATIALGISTEFCSRKPVAFLDTETGADFLLPRFREAGVELWAAKTRAFSDLIAAIPEAEKSCSVLIIDSITHFWRELCETYQRKLKRERLQFQDWQTIKREWGVYTDLFVNSSLHIIACGRAGYEYEYDFNEDGTKDLVKTATKMKVEGEFGFEPSLVIEMERLTSERDEMRSIRAGEGSARERRERKIKLSAEITPGSDLIHRAHVLKDRTHQIHGHHFDFPIFENFRPHILNLALGATHVGVDVSRTSSELFPTPSGPAWREAERRKTIALDEIESALCKIWPGQTTPEKQAKRLVVERVFGTVSWERVKGLDVDTLERGAAQTIAAGGLILTKLQPDEALNPDRFLPLIDEASGGGENNETTL